MKKFLFMSALTTLFSVNVFADTVIDTVRFHHFRPRKAMVKCNRARSVDFRCTQRRQYCTPCTQFAYSQAQYSIMRRTFHDPDNGYGRLIVKRCTANEVDNYSYRVVNRYTAKARGRFNPREVKRRACQKAMRRCERNKRYWNRCEIDRGYYPPRPPRSRVFHVNRCIGDSDRCSSNDYYIHLPRSRRIKELVFYAHDRIGSRSDGKLNIYVDGNKVVGRLNIKSSGRTHTVRVNRRGSTIRFKRIDDDVFIRYIEVIFE